MTPKCKTTVDELTKTNTVFAGLSVEQLLYAAIKDTDYETVMYVLTTTEWSKWA
jgi:hypothetical protein